MSNYDAKTEATISGTVDRITQESGHRGRHGIHLFVKADNGAVEVRKEGKTLILRNSQGAPKWSQGRRS